MGKEDRRRRKGEDIGEREKARRPRGEREKNKNKKIIRRLEGRERSGGEESEGVKRPEGE